MKKLALVTLVCLNVALLGTLVARSLPQADAQVAVRVPAPAAPNYLLMTGHIKTDQDVVYVLDVNSAKLLAWEFDHKTKRFEAIRLGRNLVTDFSK